MKEVFKDIPGYENYQVSDLGRVRSLERVIYNGNDHFRIQKERILKLRTSTNGYYYVILSRKGKHKTLRVHRLMLFAFKGPSDLICNHIDGNKLNNKLSNLEYCTYSENAIHAYKNGLYKNIKKVDQLGPRDNYIRSFDSMHEAKRQTGIADSAISLCCNDKQKTAGRYKWRFSNCKDAVYDALLRACA